jgi:hypothetical protein
MSTKTWSDTSFWESYQQDKIRTILKTTDDEGRVITQQLSVDKYAPDGSENIDFKEIISVITAQIITLNTNLRNEKKSAERAEAEQRRLEQEKARELQRLFEAKIQAFEIDSIKNSTNRILKSKLRKAANLIEVNIYSMMIVMEELNNAEESAAE